MAEYIDRDMFLKIISHKPSSPTTDREDRLINGFISAVKNCPAADAIEELTAYVRQIEELRKDGYYLQKTKMMTYGQATMTRPLPEPPKGE